MYDDLMQLALEFLGDIDETVEELRNKHAFCRIDKKKTGETFAHHCRLCRCTLLYKTKKGLARHCRSVEHKVNARSDRKLRSIRKVKKTLLCPKRINVVEIEYKEPT